MHALCRSWRGKGTRPRLTPPEDWRYPRMRTLSIAVVLLLLAATISGVAAPGASPEGYWRTAGGHGIIEIARCGADDTLCGKLTWFSIDPGDPNPEGLDLKNPDPTKRNRPLCGLTFMYGFKPAGPDHWEGGIVYDAESGNTYNATMALRPDGKLDLHGYIGISLLGRSEIWTRANQPASPCPGH